MKHITIIVPTYKRFDSLCRLLRSIPLTPLIDTIVMFDNDYDNYMKFKQMHFTKINSMYSPINIGSVACRNKMAELVPDGLLFLCDDMELPDNFQVNKITEDFTKMFLDDDGVFGLKQDLAKYDMTGVALIGKKFLQRYPEKHFLYPNYWTFASSEIFLLANKLNKFQQYDLTVKHYHPCSKRAPIDETHLNARKWHKQDKEIKQNRLNNNLIWGDTHE